MDQKGLHYQISYEGLALQKDTQTPIHLEYITSQFQLFAENIETETLAPFPPSTTLLTNGGNYHHFKLVLKTAPPGNIQVR